MGLPAESEIEPILRPASPAWLPPGDDSDEVDWGDSEEEGDSMMGLPAEERLEGSELPSEPLYIGAREPITVAASALRSATVDFATYRGPRSALPGMLTRAERTLGWVTRECGLEMSGVASASADTDLESYHCEAPVDLVDRLLGQISKGEVSCDLIVQDGDPRAGVG